MSILSHPNSKSSMAFHCVINLFLICFSFPYVAGHDSKTAYEALQEYDFPVGLLPKGVTGYELNESTGKFSVHLNGSCSFSIDSYKLNYKSTIKGVVTKDRVSKLSGIQVKVLLLWLGITEVIRSSDELQFSVGIASANFPISNFYESPSCGCGFDCVNAKAKKDEFNALLSSS